jgi:hypothetical protein
MNLSMDIKLAFDKFISSVYGAFPFVFKNDLNEIYQEIHDLKKKVKELEHGAGNGMEAIEEKNAKKAKK